MSQFRSTGGLDDSIASDGDRGFYAVNQRLQLNQLQPGEVRESLNGRMEGFWKPRKNVVSVSPALTTGGVPLNLPFHLIGVVEKVITSVTRSGTTITVTANSHGFSAGDSVHIEGVGYRRGTNPNGTFVIATVATNTFTYTLTGASGTYTTSAFSKATDLSKAIESVSYADDLVTMTVTGHGIAIGEVGNLIVSGLVFTGSADNGVKAITAATVDTLTFEVSGVSAVTLGSTPRITQINVNDAAASEVLASCLFSDSSDSNKEYIILALETLAKKVEVSNLATYTVTNIPYPVGATVSSNCDVIQCFDKVMILRDGQQAFEWYPNGRVINSAAQLGTTVSINLRDHGLTVGASIVVSDLIGTTPPNGTFTVTSIVDKDQFTYTAVSSTTETFDVSEAIVTDGFTFSPGGPYTQPQTFNASGLEIKALDGLVTVNVTGNATINKNDSIIIYETNIPEFSSILNKQFQVSNATVNKIEFYAPVSNYTRDIVSASQTGTTVTMVVKGHNFANGTSITVAGMTGVNGGTIPNGTQTVTSVTGDQFTYTAAAALSYYTIPTPLNITNVTIPTTGTVRIEVLGHGLATTGWANVSGLDSNINGNYLLTKHSSDELEFSVPGVTSVTDTTGLLSQMTYQFTTTGATAKDPTRSSQQIEVGGRFSVGGGFMHQPGAPWGTYFQRRLWVPYYYEQSGTSLIPEYTNRKITDEIVASDILDTTTFDQIANQFRISGGTADYVVAMHGFYDDLLVVLNRNSIHGVYGTQGTLQDTVVKELTNEIGCIARKSVVMQANNLLFLSDDGVYGLTFLNDYNLRGSEEPLSKNIQPYIDRINKNLANDSVGIYFNNRYYLAVPLDSVAGANNARGNNSVLIYNFLNKGWESVDTYGDSRFLIKNFITSGAGVRNNLYAVSANGGLHQIDALESANDELSVTNNTLEIESASITSRLITRGYDFGVMDRKRFTDAQIQMQSLVNEEAEFSIAFGSEDPDSAEEIGTTTLFLGGQVLSPSEGNEAETANIRCRLAGIRGYTGTLTLTRTIGSPKVHSTKVSGSITNRQIISQR